MALEMKHASKDLKFLGRLLLDNRELSFWERDTLTLPRFLQLRRRKYRDFARRELRPLSLEVEDKLPDYDPWPIVLKAAAEGFLTELMLPPAGSLPLQSLFYSIGICEVLKAEEFCAACGGLGLLLLAHDLGVAPLVISGDLRAGLKWQKKIYREIKGQKKVLVAFAITEPGAGSDVEETEGARSARIVTRARPTTGGYVINGRKCFISNGALAKYVTLFSAIEDEGVESWTCFLIDKDMQGLSVGRSEKKLGQKAADASELILEDVFVPKNRVIGKLRGGWAINRNVLNVSRIPVATIAMGIARGAVESAIEFCRQTKLGNRALINYQDVQISLADMLIDLQVMRTHIWYTSLNSFRAYQAGSSVAKVYCSDTAFTVCNRAMEIMGDHGYLHSHKAEKCMRDARLNQIYEGTNQINRLAVIEGQWETDILGQDINPANH